MDKASEDAKAQRLKASADIDARLSTMESKMKQDFKDQAIARDSKVNNTLENLRQNVASNVMASVDVKLGEWTEEWKETINSRRQNTVQRLDKLGSTRDSLLHDVTTLKEKMSAGANDEILKSLVGAGNDLQGNLNRQYDEH